MFFKENWRVLTVSGPAIGAEILFCHGHGVGEKIAADSAVPSEKAGDTRGFQTGWPQIKTSAMIQRLFLIDR